MDDRRMMEEMLQRDRPAEIAAWQQREGQMDPRQYRHPHVEKPEQITLSAHQKANKIGSVRAAVSERMEDVYTTIDAVRRNPEPQISRLHHARGARLLDQGEDVLELDMAGSGYTEFPHEYAGRENKEGRYGRQYHRGREHILMKSRQHENGREKRRITMAGPLSMGGMRNAGEYSIENLRQYMLRAAQNYLTLKFNNWRGMGISPHPIHIMIRGHSRGAVAAGEGAMMIRNWLHHNREYQQFESYVRFDLIQYDPVPGFGSASGMNDQIDLRESDSENGIMSLGDEAETTVIYSLHTQYSRFFTPQSVKGAKRIILTPFTHSVGLDQADETQGEKAHRGAFTDAGTGEVYRNSGLSELGEGVYIVDESNNLVRMPDYGMAEGIIRKVLERTSGQGGRHSRILEVVREWFGARENLQQNQ